jgi:hypothetical protein
MKRLTSTYSCGNQKSKAIKVRLDQTLLLFLFDVFRVASQTGTVFLELKLFAPALAADCVVVVARFGTDEKNYFHLFLAFATTFLCHRLTRSNLIRQRDCQG